MTLISFSSKSSIKTSLNLLTASQNVFGYSVIIYTSLTTLEYFSSSLTKAVITAFASPSCWDSGNIIDSNLTFFSLSLVPYTMSFMFLRREGMPTFIDASVLFILMNAKAWKFSKPMHFCMYTLPYFYSLSPFYFIFAL